MKLQATGFCHIGTVRSKNQDAVLLHDQVFQSGFFDFESEELSRFFVADGVGGAPAGEIASNYILSEINKRFKGSSFPDKNEILEVLIKINSDLVDYSSANPQLIGMASTLTGVFFGKQEYRLVNAGDSKVMLFRDGDLQQLTRDDVMEIDEIHKPITNFFGGLYNSLLAPKISADAQECKNGDIFFVASDGIFHCFSNEQISMVLNNSKSLQENAKRILTKSLSMGSPDNISCVFIKVII